MYTNKDLLNFHKQSVDLRNTLAGKALEGWLDEYDKANGEAEAIASKKLEMMEREHFIFQGNTLTYKGVGKDKKPATKHGKTLEGFTEKRQKFLKTEIKIEMPPCLTKPLATVS